MVNLLLLSRLILFYAKFAKKIVKHFELQNLSRDRGELKHLKKYAPIEK